MKLHRDLSQGRISLLAFVYKNIQILTHPR